MDGNSPFFRKNIPHSLGFALLSPVLLFLLGFLSALYLVRLITLTLRERRDLRTILLSVLYGLFAIFLVGYIQYQSRQLDSVVEQNMENSILGITAVSGLITALSGLYGQIVSARKVKMEIELARRQRQSKSRRRRNLEACKRRKGRPSKE